MDLGRVCKPVVESGLEVADHSRVAAPSQGPLDGTLED